MGRLPAVCDDLLNGEAYGRENNKVINAGRRCTGTKLGGPAEGAKNEPARQSYSSRT